MDHFSKLDYSKTTRVLVPRGVIVPEESDSPEKGVVGKISPHVSNRASKIEPAGGAVLFRKIGPGGEGVILLCRSR